jgi:hypothetical protein
MKTAGWTQHKPASPSRSGLDWDVAFVRAENKIVGEKAVGVKQTRVQAKPLADSTTSRCFGAKKKDPHGGNVRVRQWSVEGQAFTGGPRRGSPAGVVGPVRAYQNREQ